MYTTRKRHGFTLVELLVVIAIIAMLIAITVPVLKTAKENAKAVICGSNIRQIQLAMTEYESQNHNKLPYALDSSLSARQTTPPGDWASNSSDDTQGWWWFQFIANFLGDKFDKKTVLWCPSRWIKDIKIKPNILLGNYGVNQEICKIRLNDTSVISLSDSSKISHASQTVLVLDSGYSSLTWTHAMLPDQIPSSFIQNWDDKRNDSGYVPGLYKVNKERLAKFRKKIDFTLDARSGRHLNRTVNAGFVDGHIDRKNADDFYVEKTGDDYKNRSPLWLP
jgi:prepilin-type N-terminal cleavage/methylation domain-containing protein/prepilin-type processing-associated H-X9-DG protein